MDLDDEIGLGQHEHVAIALEFVIVGREARTAKVLLGEALALDHGAHGAVLDEDPLCEQGFEFVRSGRGSHEIPPGGFTGK